MMWRSLRDRLGRLTATMWLIVTVAFFCAYKLPGDPARMILGQKATPDAIENFRHQTGLDQPIAVQYSRFVRRALTLDLGESLVQRRPVADLIRERSGQTLILILVSLLFLVLCGLALPVSLRLIEWQLPQKVYRSFWTFLAIAPPYVLSILALLGFAGWLRWIPVSFDGTRPTAWIVPALVLAAYPIAVIHRQPFLAMLHRNHHGFVQLYHRQPAAPFPGATAARVVDQQTPHHLRRDGEKVRPVLPAPVSLVHQPEEGVMHQDGGLHGAIRPLGIHASRRQPVQLIVNNRSQTGLSFLVTALGLGQQSGNLGFHGFGALVLEPPHYIAAFLRGNRKPEEVSEQSRKFRFRQSRKFRFRHGRAKRRLPFPHP